MSIGQKRINLLWLTSTNLKKKVCAGTHTFGGGWIVEMFRSLKQRMADPNSEIERITVVCTSDDPDFTQEEIDGVEYYQFPIKYAMWGNRKVEEWMKGINQKIRPDVVHIHGTEYSTGLMWMKAAGSSNVLLSIQGLTSVISRYYLYGIDEWWKYLTFRDIIRRDNLRQQQLTFARRGEKEIEQIMLAKHVAGRTAWDYAHVRALNPEVKYHRVGETLRDAFYRNRWKYGECKPHSIFVSQASYPIKGLHFLLQGAALVKRKYPDIQIRVAGEDIIGKSGLRMSGYGKFLKKLIRRMNLEENVSFIGSQDEEGMLREYLSANLFVLPSVIENSPNSLGEAMQLGMPCLASICGGTPEMTGMNPHILYRCEEIEELAEKISKVFGRGEKEWEQFSKEFSSSDLFSAKRVLESQLQTYKDIALSNI